MRAIISSIDASNEVTILARVLSKDSGELPTSTARYYLSLQFNESDKARMHELAQRNQEGLLTEAERQEMLAYAKAGSLLSILKSRARRVLHLKAKKSTKS